MCGDSTQVVASGKMYGVGGIIHNVAYADDVARELNFIVQSK